MFGNDEKSINWNAGSEFNQLVGKNKELFIYNQANGNTAVLLPILSADLDLTYQKILIEAKKDKNAKYEDVEKELEDIRKKVLELQDEFIKVMKTPEQLENFKIDIIKLSRRIWDLQGYFGVMYPVDKSEKSDPGQAIRNF